MSDHDRLTEKQFGPRAAAYLHSAVHRAGADLDAIEAAARQLAPDCALDLGTGGGHVALRLARHAAAVVACDLSASMLETVTEAARNQGLDNVETRRASAERLPFPDGRFDLVASRFSAHHWRDLEGALREARRVLRQGGTALFADVVSPGPALLDTHLQAVELLRDPSHVRDHAAAEWLAALARSGFAVRDTRPGRLTLDYAAWVERMATPEPHRAAIRSLQRGAGAEVAAHFGIGGDGTFMVDTLLIEAVATA